MQQHPQKIDKYQILSVIGKGAMGVVYHGYDPMVKRDVALKLLSSLDLEEQELISRFEREARLAGSLRHPNIVTIYDLGHFDGRPYIVMEYILGTDLEKVIKEKQPLPLDQRIQIILQICRGLVAAHQKGIIHRDIKPANIRLQEDGSVKIMDFGIARMGTSELTKSGFIIGTLQYMSPEQISGEPLDSRTDLFSTGLIAYELFTGTNPFAGGGAVDIMYRVLNLRPQPISSLPEDIGTEINQIILRALEKNRELRYSNAKDLAQDLEEVHFYLKSKQFQTKKTERQKNPPSHPENLPLDRVPQKAPVPPTVVMDLRSPSFPTFGVTEPEKVSRTGVGANYSETAQQVLMKPAGGWHEKKFFIIGALAALVFIGGLFYAAFKPSNAPISQDLLVNSKPDGAEIWMDGTPVGKTPYKITEQKDAELTFRLKGYKEKKIPLWAEAWPAVINVNLQKEAAPSPVEPQAEPQQQIAQVPGAHKIQVETIPAGAVLSMDGDEMGTTPVEVVISDDKAHQLKLHLDGYQAVEANIDRQTSSVLTMSLQEIALPGIVKYTGAYPVTILSGGKPFRTSSISLPPGTYKLTFITKQRAYIRFSKSIEVKAGQTVTVPGPAMGSLSVKANPSNCKISVNGEYLDDAPIFNMPIQTGTHVIEFHWPKLGTKLNKTVIIQSGQTETVIGIPE